MYKISINLLNELHTTFNSPSLLHARKQEWFMTGEATSFAQYVTYHQKERGISCKNDESDILRISTFELNEADRIFDSSNLPENMTFSDYIINQQISTKGKKSSKGNWLRRWFSKN